MNPTFGQIRMLFSVLSLFGLSCTALAGDQWGRLSQKPSITYLNQNTTIGCSLLAELLARESGECSSYLRPYNQCLARLQEILSVRPEYAPLYRNFLSRLERYNSAFTTYLKGRLENSVDLRSLAEILGQNYLRYGVKPLSRPMRLLRGARTLFGVRPVWGELRFVHAEDMLAFERQLEVQQSAAAKDNSLTNLFQKLTNSETSSFAKFKRAWKNLSIALLEHSDGREPRVLAKVMWNDAQVSFLRSLSEFETYTRALRAEQELGGEPFSRMQNDIQLARDMLLDLRGHLFRFPELRRLFASSRSETEAVRRRVLESGQEHLSAEGLLIRQIDSRLVELSAP